MRSPSPRGFVLVVLAVLVGAGALRCIGLSHREFWHDEYCSLLYATAPEGTPRALRAGGNPPLYFLLLRVWMALFGAEEGAVRALSVVFSTASIGALGLWLRSMDLPRRAVLWSITLAAVTPLHLFYAREARGYGLVLLLLGLSLWSFTRALRGGGVRWWALHGSFCVLSFYTHNLLVPMVAVFWLAAWVWTRWPSDRGVTHETPRRMWASMAVAHAVALSLYAPWVGTLAGQIGSGQEQWIVRFWKSYPPLLAIPRSLQAFAVGGPIPIYIAWPSPAVWFEWLSGGFFLIVAIFALASESRPWPERRALAVLLVLLFVPLLGLWLVSALDRPIYVVGRYDLVALPAFLGVMGFGIDALQRFNFGSRTRWSFVPSSVPPVILLPVIVIGALLPRYQTDAAPDRRPNRERADLLARDVRPGDLLVAHDLAASNVLFLARQRRIDAKIVTFPHEILDHWGWFNADESMQRGRDTLLKEAATVLEAQKTAHPEGRVWLLPHLKVLSPPGTPHRGNPHQELFDIFVTACREEGMSVSYPPGADRREYDRVGIVPFAFH